MDSMGFAELPDFILQRQHEVKMNHKREDSAVTLDTSGIEIEQHDGLWHTADVREIRMRYLSYENNEYGDSVAAVIVNADGELVAQELENGFDKGAMEAIQEYLAEKGMTWERNTRRANRVHLWRKIIRPFILTHYPMRWNMALRMIIWIPES